MNQRAGVLQAASARADQLSGDSAGALLELIDALAVASVCVGLINETAYAAGAVVSALFDFDLASLNVSTCAPSPATTVAVDDESATRRRSAVGIGKAE